MLFSIFEIPRHSECSFPGIPSFESMLIKLQQNFIPFTRSVLTMAEASDISVLQADHLGLYHHGVTHSHPRPCSLHLDIDL